MKSDISLICLDFDGTIVQYDGDETFFHPCAVDLLNQLASEGVDWCTNSGRDLPSQRKILELSVKKGLVHKPRALLCSETFIFEPIAGKYVACEPWNTSALILLRRFNERVRDEVAPHLDGWRKAYEPEIYTGETYTVFNLRDTDGLPKRFMTDLVEALRGVPHAQVTQNGGWVAVLPEQMGKGNVLRSYLRYIDTPVSRVLAIGDHLNDLTMLDGTAAAHVGCPGDAVAEVQAVVRKAGGYVASASGPEGTVEVIRRLLEGRIVSE